MAAVAKVDEAGRVRAFPARVDLLLVADMVEAHSRVLDVGCGDGTLLRLLAEDKGVDGRGIELSQAGTRSREERTGAAQVAQAAV